MSNVDWRLVGYPGKELYAVCLTCNTEIVRKTWDGYIDFKYWRDKLKKQYTVCPVCKAKNKQPPVQLPTWSKRGNGDWLAMAKFGDFLIWKYGRAYKWRYREYGRESANCVGFASTLEIAKTMCEKHEGWQGS